VRGIIKARKPAAQGSSRGRAKFLGLQSEHFGPEPYTKRCFVVPFRALKCIHERLLWHSAGKSSTFSIYEHSMSNKTLDKD
jgi:hypothetical protein